MTGRAPKECCVRNYKPIWAVACLAALSCSACEKKSPDANPATSAYKFIEQTYKATPPTTLVELCRSLPEGNRQEVERLSRNGWVYAGPLYNDGLNCTVTLWTCPDNRKECEARVEADHGRSAGTDEAQ